MLFLHIMENLKMSRRKIESSRPIFRLDFSSTFKMYFKLKSFKMQIETEFSQSYF